MLLPLCHSTIPCPVFCFPPCSKLRTRDGLHREVQESEGFQALVRRCTRERSAHAVAVRAMRTVDSDMEVTSEADPLVRNDELREEEAGKVFRRQADEGRLRTRELGGNAPLLRSQDICALRTLPAIRCSVSPQTFRGEF